MTEETNETTIHVDADWKAEAAREKQRLLTEEKKAATRGGQTDLRFVELLNLLGMQASISLAGYQGPGGETIPADLGAAQQQIAMIESLQRKTEGNLSDEERRGLNDLLHGLRMQYVRISEAMAAAGAPPADEPGGSRASAR
jgi:hypothetical protein